MKGKVFIKDEVTPQVKELQKQVRELQRWKADTVWMMKYLANEYSRRLQFLEKGCHTTDKTVCWILAFNVTVLAWLCFITFVLCK